MNKVKIDNEKYLYCPDCGANYCRYNESIVLMKRVSFVIIDKITGEILTKCAKCKREIKFP